MATGQVSPAIPISEPTKQTPAKTREECIAELFGKLKRLPEDSPERDAIYSKIQQSL